jgi:voltage-gated potassium channel Kch
MFSFFSFYFLVAIAIVLPVSASASDVIRDRTFLGVETHVHAAAARLASKQTVDASKELHPQDLMGAATVHHNLQDRNDQPAEDVNTGERTFWPPDRGNGVVAWLFAALFVILIATVPCILHVTAQGLCMPGCTVIIEGCALVVWLITGLICFTQVFYFASPHFAGAERTLTLVEAVYLFAQIITTVGYGDIIPAYLGGQIFVGIFVFCAIMLIAGMVSEISSQIVARAEERVAKAVEEASAHLAERDFAHVLVGRQAANITPLLISGTFFICCVIAGTCFYALYPGEGKTWGQGLYMSVITLTTVGFGAFTAETEGGKVFGAFWMLIGVASLGAVVAGFTEFLVAMKEEERPNTKSNDADKILHEFTDHKGQVDKIHYLQYALLKYEIASKHQVDAILKQFEILDEEKSGSVSAEKLQELAETSTARSAAELLESHGSLGHATGPHANRRISGFYHHGDEHHHEPHHHEHHGHLPGHPAHHDTEKRDSPRQ